jgi:hypothetical protein
MLSIRCASRGSAWKQPGETFPSNAFTLRLKASPVETMVGAPLVLEYVLTNITEQPVSACADSWSNYHVRGTRGEKGQATVSLDAVSPERIFRIPPHASLVWRVDVRTPDVGDGPATIRGMLNSSCSLWSGSVVSDPVTVTIRSASSH